MSIRINNYLRRRKNRVLTAWRDEILRQWPGSELPGKDDLPETCLGDLYDDMIHVLQREEVDSEYEPWVMTYIHGKLACHSGEHSVRICRLLHDSLEKVIEKVICRNDEFRYVYSPQALQTELYRVRCAMNYVLELELNHCASRCGLSCPFNQGHLNGDYERSMQRMTG